MEMMIVIAIIGILSAIAAPRIVVWRSNATLNREVREIVANVQHARAEAIKTNTVVTTVVGGTTIRFNSRGLPVKADGSPIDAVIEVKVTNDTQEKIIELNVAGGVRMKK